MKEAVFAAAAASDMLDIWEYVRQNGSEFAADRFARELVARTQRLALAPGLGRPRPEFGRDVRGYTLKKYLILYPPTQTGVSIARIVHGARDLENVVGEL